MAKGDRRCVRAPNEAGERHVCGTRSRWRVAPGQAAGAAHTKLESTRLRVPQAVGSGNGPPQPADRARPSRPQPRPAHGGSRRDHGRPAHGRGCGYVRRRASGRDARTHISTEPCAASPHPQARAAREASPSRDPDRERQGGAGRAEEHPGADLRGGLLPDLARLSAGQVCAWGAGASQEAPASRRDGSQPKQWASAPLPMGHRGRYSRMLRQHQPSRSDGAGQTPRR